MQTIPSLAAHATPVEGLRGRPVHEDEDGIRSAFQRDRARIIHCQAFRRLAGKTQVFVAGEGDHYRTRLTHTMEVAQITRDLARALGLNEDLAECVALAHDVGHTPFGHAGQDALDAWMRGHGGRFEHNVQSHRIVTVLEMRKRGINGLNLTRDVSDGLLKHGVAPLSLEARLANVCDEIAYTAHDCDDGLRAGFFTLEELRTIPLAADAADEAERRGGLAVRSTIIDVLARDLLAGATPEGIDLSPEMRARLRPLREFLWTRMYNHPHVLERTARGQRAIRSLCDTLLGSPPPPVVSLRERTNSSLHEAVKDYVAGMTDAFALRGAEGAQ